MADFFSRLVQRSLGLSSTVQPAIAPRFSSAPAIADEINLQWNRDAQQPATPAAVTRSSSELPPQPSPAVPVPLLPGSDTSIYPGQKHLIQKEVQHPPSIPPSQPNLSIQSSSSPPQFNSERLTPFSQSIALAQSLAEESSQTAAPAPFRVAQSPDSVQSYPSLAIAYPNRELPAESQIVPNPALIQPIPSQEHSDRPTVSQPMPLTQPAALIDLHSTRPALDVVAELAALPPTIRISIGRVEVRAIMPTPPAPKVTSVRPRPVVSLDAYLQQRGRKP